MVWHKPPFQLKEIKIEVTHDCMLRCVHCSSIAGENTGRSMDWSFCKKILDDAAVMGVKEVAFSGGEPLLWAHIERAVDQASRHGMVVHLYTTGNAPGAEKLLETLRGSGLSKVMLSLFGPDAKRHEAVTMRSESYNKTIAMVECCVSMGVHTEFHFVPLPHNFLTLKQLAYQAQKMGARRISVLRLVPHGRGASKEDTQLSHAQNMELRLIIKNLRESGHDIRLGSPYNFLMLRDKPQCCSGIDRITIGPDLKIFPCDAFKHIAPADIAVSSDFSSLQTYSLAECWERSPYLWAIRKYLTTDFAHECSICAKLEDCQSGCVAQKFYAFGALKKCPDPMCILGKH
jgi:PqqA peptide cyclase